MLDAETRRRIDSCRNILVGKVPDPKSQVEQITIALIYKFMDDMDAEAEELGGKRSFFAKGYAKYGWTKLMAPGLGGFEVLTLYSEAIATMTANPGVPALFRDIFKNAYLPYRDPETLKSFLKEIDWFSYDHSEKLGDAFEYLLSVLGSQGDAGQFRTPRHIIDFMVEVIAPQKHESILDPACGTAGFLISAWKHILRNNSGKQALKPAERQRLAANIHGYDISPDMVRLSLVNMYLHGFSDPHIIEYDTLTSDERWNETADVILANPPFMSPKGGIKPHKRFSVQATRSEVLFVDYMAEHLSPQGRAAIIVPEGIIFQSGTAYKKLREMLVKNALVAVVSLPAGVFNPYAGVKTSILILDKRLAKTSDSVLFVKVENDGFGLGAQRRAVAGTDLTEAAHVLRAWMTGKADQESALATRVEKARIGENGEWNLSGERYFEVAPDTGTYEHVPLERLCDYVRGVTYAKNDEVAQDGLQVLRANNIDATTSKLNLTDIKLVSTNLRFSDSQRLKKSDILICAASGSADHVGKVAFVEEDTTYFFGGFMAVLRCNEHAEPRFLFECLRMESFRAHLARSIAGANINNLKASIVHSFRVPLPPLAIQQEIAAEIEGYQKIIDGARQVVENYQPRIAVQPDWPKVELGKLCALGGKITTDVDLSRPYIGADSIAANNGCLLKLETAQSQQVNGPVYEFSGHRLLYSKIRPYLNKLAVVDLDGYCSSDMYPLVPDQTKVLTSYLATYMLSVAFNESIRGYYERASIPKINRTQLFATQVPLPPLETQRAIVAEIEAEQALVDASKQLIARFEAKIRTAIDRVWGEA